MRLLRATINGFGNWVDTSIDFESESLICLYGENEAGKSTMQQFILFMLFGLSPKWRTFYRPKTSSRMGGRLLVTDVAFGEFTIERFDEVRNGQAICYTPDGKEYPEEWLKERLNGMTYSTYQSTFSFSALDLYGIKTMSGADLGEVLLGIGLTGSKNILAIEKDLDNRMGALFKPSGTKPEMNQQLDKLDTLFQQLTCHKNDEATYREKKIHIQSLKKKMGALQEQHKIEKDTCNLLEKQQQALPLIEDYKYCTRQLNTYSDSLYFPENGLERLRQFNESILPLKSELSVLRDNYKEYSEKQEELNQQFYDEAVYKQAETLLLSKPIYVATQRDIKLLNETIEKEHLQLRTALEQLQIGLTVADLELMVFPFHLERTWNELKQTSEELNLEKERLEDEHFFLTGKMNSVTTEQKSLKASLPDEEEIIKLTEKMDAYHKQDYVKTRTEKDTQDKIKWKHITNRKRRQSNMLVASSGVLTLLFVIIGIMKNTSSTPFIIAIFVFIIGLSQWIWQKQSIKSLTALLHTDEYVDNGPTITTEEKDAAARILHDSRKTQQALHIIVEQRRTLDIQMMQWEEKEQGLHVRESRHTNQIQEQCETYPFLWETNSKYWPELFHTLKHLLQSVQKQHQLQEELENLNKVQEELQQELSAFFEQHDFVYDNGKMNAQLEHLEELMEQFRASKSHMKQFSEWMEKNKENQQTIYQQIVTYEAEMNALYKLANVNTAEKFYQIAKEVDEKNRIMAQQQQLEHQIKTILTQVEYQAMQTEFLNQYILQDRLDQAALKMDECTNSIEEIREELANENVELVNMEASEDYSQTTHRFQMEKEQLQKWAYEWSVLKTAKEMLVETKRIYRDKYLHKVLDKTSTYFSTLTGGRYKQIFAPSDDTLFQVESKDLVRYNVQELSKGTIDQLYISLRLAISKVLSQDLLLPFVIDDAFVHFDSIRTERMMHIFAELATKQQIIIFTSNWDVYQSEKMIHKIDLGNGVRIKA